jgi:hypothetical protein
MRRHDGQPAGDHRPPHGTTGAQHTVSFGSAYPQVGR